MKKAWVALCLTVAACEEAEPRPQWTIVISTDAPVPQLGDRLLVELYDESGALACDGCRRVFSAGNPAIWPISFGAAAPPDGSPVRVRARLHRADHVGFDGTPSGAAHLDALARLPAEPARVELALAMRCFGVLADAVAGLSCDAATGALAAEPIAGADGTLAVGSWPGAEAVPCPSDAPAAMACIAGGAFLLGSPFTVPPVDASDATLPERLVRLSPFALDKGEVTVATVRALVQRGAIGGEPVVRSADPKTVNAACTWLGAEVADNDALPANCLVRALGGEICQALGKRLPTEAEWEYAAGNGAGETPYPWGYDGDVCAHAIVARGRVTEAYTPEPSSCRTNDGDVLPYGLLPGGSEADETATGVRNLGGNVAEWVADKLAGYDSACWSGGAPELTDPLCQVGTGPMDDWSIRGGSWNNFEYAAKVAERLGSPYPDPGVGVRCARSF